MNSPIVTPSQPRALDGDLADQAREGHGIPSQDPSSAAQVMLEPKDAEREADSALVGGGAVAGMATGAAVGGAVAGPLGVVIGASLGAVAGAVGGAALGPTLTQTARDAQGLPIQDAVRLHIEDSGGNGRPVLLIHGWPLSAEAWKPQIAALQAAGYRVVTYDRRGFGRSEKPASGYSYDTLAEDLERVMEQCSLQDVSLVGFSMGGGEVARYIGRFGEARLHSVVFAAAITPYLLKTESNPEGPLTPEAAQKKRKSLESDRSAFFDKFTRDFYSTHGQLRVTELQRSEAIALCHLSARHAALDCMDSFSSTDFRADLEKVTVPTLVIHGAADAIVPFEGSGQRTHHAVRHSKMVKINAAPHGLNVSHAVEFNDALLSFLRE